MHKEVLYLLLLIVKVMDLADKFANNLLVYYTIRMETYLTH